MSQLVDSKSVLSDMQGITHCELQCSILEPLLLNVFMNDALEVVKEIMNLYADHTTLHPIKLNMVRQVVF